MILRKERGYTLSGLLRLIKRKRIRIFLKTRAVVDRRAALYSTERITLTKGCRVNSFSVIKPESGYIKLGIKTIVDENCVFYGNGGIEIGQMCIFAPGAMLMATGHGYEDKNKSYFGQPLKAKGIKIGNNVQVGANATILDGVTIGDNCVIGAGSVVLKNQNIPADSLVVGNPAKIKKSLPPRKWKMLE